MTSAEKDPRIRTLQEGTWYPHRLLWNPVLANLLEVIEEEPELRSTVGLTALLITHTCFEAYLNYAGELLYKDGWEDLERLRIRAKLRIVADKLGTPLNPGQRPLQSVLALNTWRNRIMHPRIESRQVEATVREPSEIPKLDSEFLESVSAKFIDQSVADVATLCDSMQAIAHEKHPYRFMSKRAFVGTYGSVRGSILHD